MVWDVQVIDSLGQVTHVPWISRVDVDIEVVLDLRGSWIDLVKGSMLPKWEFPKIRGTLSCGPCKKDPTI